jgi:hypothetical protein
LPAVPERQLDPTSLPFRCCRARGHVRLRGRRRPGPDITDTVTDYSAYRHANWSFIVLDVQAPRFPGGEPSVLVRAIDPTQNSSGITSIASPTVMDSVTLVRRSGIAG